MGATPGDLPGRERCVRWPALRGAAPPLVELYSAGYRL